MSNLAVVLSTTMVAQTVRMAIPYASAALGGVLCEKSGVPNIALEGILLGSAFASIAVSLATGSIPLGAAAAVLTGALIGLIHAVLVLRARVDAIVSGIVINLVSASATRVLLRGLYGSSSNSPSIEVAARGAGGLLDVAIDPFVLGTLFLAFATSWMLGRSRFGLHLRASGEDAEAADAVGIHVANTRTVAVVLGSAIGGFGGAALALDLHQFQAGMSGGRGFIALAAVIVSGYRPWPAVMCCAIFAALEALQIVLQNQTRIPPSALSILPFVATLLVLMPIARRRSRSR